MKKLLLCLLLVSVNSFAIEAVAELTNKMGGKIVLTESLCSNKTSRIAYTTDPGTNRTYTGCWAYDELFFHIRWDEDGAITSYPMGSFKQIGQKRGTGI